jgi:hypothetical protein
MRSKKTATKKKSATHGRKGKAATATKAKKKPGRPAKKK